MGKIVDQVMSLVRNKPADDGGRRVVGRDDRLRTGFDQAPIGVAFAQASGDWLYANERFLRAVGYTLPELGRITFASITHDDDAKKEAVLLKRLAAGEIESYRIEKRVMAKNGLYRRLDVLTAIARSSVGKFIHLIYITDEPQPSKRHEPARESERFLLQLLDELREVAIIRTDDRGTITGWNAGATRLLGYARDEIIGKNRRVLYRDADSWDGKSTGMMKSVEESGRIEGEDWRVTRDGKHLWVKTSLTPARVEGAVKGYVETIMPSSVQRSADAPAQLERLRAELEHERRTGDTLRSAIDDFRVGSEQTMNELRILTGALRKEIDRRKSLEVELRRLNERLAAEPEVLVEEEMIEAPAPQIVWKPVTDAADLLRARAAAQASGTLLVRAGEGRKEIFFEKGRVFSCASNDPTKFLTQRLLESSTITEEQRRRALEIKKETDLPLGRILLILDAITEEQLVKMMRAKVVDEVSELLEWRDAEWAFDEGQVASLKLVPLRMEVEQLLEIARGSNVEVVIVSTKSRKMHRESCISARRVSSIALRVFYGGEAEAEAAGFERCRQCFR